MTATAKSRRWTRAIGFVLWAVTIGALVAVVRDRVDELRDLPALPAWQVLVGITAVHVIGNGLLVTAWRRIVALVSSRLDWWVAARIWALSQLARFSLAAAQVGARAALGRRAGIGAGVGAVTTLVEIGWAEVITPLLVLVTWPAWSGPASSLSWVPFVAVVPATVLLLGLVAPMTLLRVQAAVFRAPGLRHFTGRFADRADELRIDRRTASELSTIYLVNVLLRLGVFLVVVAAMAGTDHVDARAVGAFAVGQFVGRIALFAPGGLGPREGATVLILTSSVGGPAAVGITAVSRALEFVGELVFAALVVPPGRKAST